MMQKLTMSQARERLRRLPDELARAHNQDAVAITRRGELVLAVLPWELYEALLETLDVMSEPETLAALRRGAEDIAAGNVKDLDDVF